MEPLVSNHTIAKTQWPLSSIEKQGIYSRKRSNHNHFFGEHFWQAISKLQWLCSSSHILSSEVHKANTEIRLWVKWLRTLFKRLKTNGKLWKHLPKIGWVTYKRRSFTSGSNRIYLCVMQWAVIGNIQVSYHPNFWILINHPSHAA